MNRNNRRPSWAAAAGRRRASSGADGQSGFTILELIIVGVVIGVLAGVAIPTYFSFLKRARQVEAPAALNEIRRLQSMYFAFNGNYGTLEEIGYHPSPSLRYYTIKIELIPSSGGKPPGFKATATGNLDGDPEEDIWTIVENGTPQHDQTD